MALIALAAPWGEVNATIMLDCSGNLSPSPQKFFAEFFFKKATTPPAGAPFFINSRTHTYFPTFFT